MNETNFEDMVAEGVATLHERMLVLMSTKGNIFMTDLVEAIKDISYFTISEGHFAQELIPMTERFFYKMSLHIARSIN